VVGVGHSLGAAALLALAGGQIWLAAGRHVEIVPDGRLTRLVLLTPPMGFFQVEGALDAVQTPILAWAGSRDSITPAAHVDVLVGALSGRLPLDVRVTEGPGISLSWTCHRRMRWSRWPIGKHSLICLPKRSGSS
tara:strand:- start:20250 stop:20654 length:405 start_codon:yes stop_codon:yes gene_type:complete